MGEPLPYDLALAALLRRAHVQEMMVSGHDYNLLRLGLGDVLARAYERGYLSAFSSHDYTLLRVTEKGRDFAAGFEFSDIVVDVPQITNALGAAFRRRFWAYLILHGGAAWNAQGDSRAWGRHPAVAHLLTCGVVAQGSAIPTYSQWTPRASDLGAGGAVTPAHGLMGTVTCQCSPDLRSTPGALITFSLPMDIEDVYALLAELADESEPLDS